MILFLRLSSAENGLVISRDIQYALRGDIKMEIRKATLDDVNDISRIYALSWTPPE